MFSPRSTQVSLFPVFPQLFGTGTSNSVLLVASQSFTMPSSLNQFQSDPLVLSSEQHQDLSTLSLPSCLQLGAIALWCFGSIFFF